MTPASDCKTMAEVRAGVDEIDRALVALLAARFGFMDAAARIKPTREAVRDEARKAEVLRNVATHAAATAIPAGLVNALWEMLIEASITHELSRFDAQTGASDGTRTRDLRRDRPAL